jgi:hypothetical protein
MANTETTQTCSNCRSEVERLEKGRLVCPFCWEGKMKGMSWAKAGKDARKRLSHGERPGESEGQKRRRKIAERREWRETKKAREVVEKIHHREAWGRHVEAVEEKNREDREEQERKNREDQERILSDSSLQSCLFTPETPIKERWGLVVGKDGNPVMGKIKIPGKDRMRNHRLIREEAERVDHALNWVSRWERNKLPVCHNCGRKAPRQKGTLVCEDCFTDHQKTKNWVVTRSNVKAASPY